MKILPCPLNTIDEYCKPEKAFVNEFVKRLHGLHEFHTNTHTQKFSRSTTTISATTTTCLMLT